MKAFNLPSRSSEDDFILGHPRQFEMRCYSGTNAYPFKIFPEKGLCRLDFEPITIVYGGNGSGKSTLLNVIAEKLGMERTSPYNGSPCMTDYIERCSFELDLRIDTPPSGSKIITSDDVFDFLFDIRVINTGVDRRRESLFREYDEIRGNHTYYEEHPFGGLEDFERFRYAGEIKRNSKSDFVTRRLPREIEEKSNGESALIYFTQKIKENALYLLDEPENSLSAKYQLELLRFIEDSARFYGCQFIISTHSPFLLSMKDARIYDLDSSPVAVRPWSELENVRVYYKFFEYHKSEFD